MSTTPTGERSVLVVPHIQHANLDHAIHVLEAGGLRVVKELDNSVELVISLGGDGTFLRAADIAHRADLPVLGINLGHVGFLAEWEAESLEEAVRRVRDHEYDVEDRMTLDVSVFDHTGTQLSRTWALNEASVEKIDFHGVLDALLEVDERAVSSYGCDGVLVSTPTGSTAYTFSAGGPILWPELDAIVVVPNNAHALFARPLVVSPESVVDVSSKTAAQVVADGFRIMQIPPQGRVRVLRGSQPVRWVRLDDGTFTDRLVSKFKLPVTGWRERGA
ncbi:MAG: NAD kinase [Corynebacterium sp.]|nr:NAD kinase [Corynebacterium sp.]